MSVKTPPGMVLEKKYFKVISNSIMAAQKCKANLLTEVFSFFEHLLTQNLTN